MEEKDFKASAALEISQKILHNAYSAVLVNMRFLDCALFRLEFKASDTSLATDGRFLYYNPCVLVKNYVKETSYAPHNLLHVLLHCIFKHLFVGQNIDKKYWNSACDMAAENIICSLGFSFLNTQRSAEIAKALVPFKEKIYPFTAEKIYRFLLENVSPEKIDQLRPIFACDDHTLWYFKDEPSLPDKSDDAMSFASPKENPLEKTWDDISRHVQLDLETFSKKTGRRSGDILFQLQNINRKKYNYAEFLKKFAVADESLTINDDEFDYVYYTYGLSLYENMPLIEPLEYKEEFKIKDFVIAIDTSGSVAGSLVKKFLEQTYSILKTEESFFTKINLCIIQCDAKLQNVCRVTCQSEFDAYMENLTVKGAGGTDFRPVFEYVDALLKAKEFTRLKGLIYFTDGYGIFPEKKPAYDTAFVFFRNEYDNPKVPCWAIKLILEDI